MKRLFSAVEKNNNNNDDHKISCNDSNNNSSDNSGGNKKIKENPATILDIEGQVLGNVLFDFLGTADYIALSVTCMKFNQALEQNNNFKWERLVGKRSNVQVKLSIEDIVEAEIFLKYLLKERAKSFLIRNRIQLILAVTREYTEEFIKVCCKLTEQYHFDAKTFIINKIIPDDISKAVYDLNDNCCSLETVNCIKENWSIFRNVVFMIQSCDKCDLLVSEFIRKKGECSDHLRSDRRIMLSLIKEDPALFSYVSEQLLSDKQFVLSAIAANPATTKFAWKVMPVDMDFWDKAVGIHPTVVEYIFGLLE
jgi:hypothetical protein